MRRQSLLSPLAIFPHSFAEERFMHHRDSRLLPFLIHVTASLHLIICNSFVNIWFKHIIVSVSFQTHHPALVAWSLQDYQLPCKNIKATCTASTGMFLFQYFISRASPQLSLIGRCVVVTALAPFLFAKAILLRCPDKNMQHIDCFMPQSVLLQQDNWRN